MLKGNVQVKREQKKCVKGNIKLWRPSPWSPSSAIKLRGLTQESIWRKPELVIRGAAAFGT